MKRILLFLSIVFCCSLFKVHSQFPTKDQPLGFTLDFAKCSLTSKKLNSYELPDMKIVEEEDLVNDKETGIMRIAYPVRVNYTLHNSGFWEELPDGSRIWQFEVTLPGALLTSVMYDKFWLPEGAKFWVYNKTILWRCII